jgi:hypothetical protein
VFHEEETLSRCVLGFDHSTKSTEASSRHNDTKVVASMGKGGHGIGWVAPSYCSLFRWKPVFFLAIVPGDAVDHCKELELDAASTVRVQCVVAYSESRGRPGSFVFAFASCQGAKRS